MALIIQNAVTDMEEQYRIWGANCGPTALAAFLRMKVAEVRPFVEAVQGGKFLGYMNAGHMVSAIRQAGREPWRVDYSRGEVRWPKERGVCLLQFDGPWLESGVPFKARFKYTHFVAATRDGALIYDGNANAWMDQAFWNEKIMRVLQRDFRRATGWYTAVVIEVR